MSHTLTIDFDDDDTRIEGLIRRIADEPEVGDIIIIECARDILAEYHGTEDESDLIRELTEHCRMLRRLVDHLRARKAA